MPRKATPPAKSNAAKIKTTEKQARLAGALRQNLRRRKDRKRGGNGHGEAEAGAPAKKASSLVGKARLK